MFRLTAEEWKEISSSHFVMMENLPKNRSGKYLPYVFTEHGVTMLASVLKSDWARKMNIAIVCAFIALRKFALRNTVVWDQLNELKDKISEHDVQLSQIYDAIENLLDEKEELKTWKTRERIGFKK
jgi:hypothetical protein